MNLNEAHRRAEALFKKEQQSRGAHQAELHAMREKTARLRTLRLARDAAIQAARQNRT